MCKLQEAAMERAGEMPSLARRLDVQHVAPRPLGWNATQLPEFSLLDDLSGTSVRKRAESEAKKIVVEIRNAAIEEVAVWYCETGYLLEFEDMQDAMRALKTGH